MTSITGLDQAELLTQSLEFIANTLADCGFSVCANQRTHVEPRKLTCCDCAANSGGYTIVGWIVRAYSADGRLNEAPSFDCPVFDATTMGFTVARCWPEEPIRPKVGGKQDTTAVELTSVLSCIRSSLGACESIPGLFTSDCEHPIRCSRVRVGDFLPEKDLVVTPYGEDAGKVSQTCAGWKFTLTVA